MDKVVWTVGHCHRYTKKKGRKQVGWRLKCCNSRHSRATQTSDAFCIIEGKEEDVASWPFLWNSYWVSSLSLSLYLDSTLYYTMHTHTECTHTQKGKSFEPVILSCWRTALPSFWTTPGRIDLFFSPTTFLDPLWRLSVDFVNKSTTETESRNAQIQFRCKNFVCPFCFSFRRRRQLNEHQRETVWQTMVGIYKPILTECSPARRIQVQPIGNMLNFKTMDGDCSW